MQKITSLLGLCLLSSTFFFWNNLKVNAQSCYYLVGYTGGGNEVNVDICSISRVNPQNVGFVYFIRTTSEVRRFISQADCNDRTLAGALATDSEQKVFYSSDRSNPDFEKMLDLVCNPKTLPPKKRVVSVANQPLYIRTSPAEEPLYNTITAPNNKSLVCTVINATSINIYGSVGSWYYTDVCKRTGVVHSSQIRF
jgi:hypothetical protein